MQKIVSLKAKNVVTYIAFAMMALVSTSAKAEDTNSQDYLSFTATTATTIGLKLVIDDKTEFDYVYQNAEGNWEGAFLSSYFGACKLQYSFNKTDWYNWETANQDAEFVYLVNFVEGLPSWNFSQAWSSNTYKNKTIPAGATLYVKRDGCSSDKRFSNNANVNFFSSEALKVSGNVMSLIDGNLETTTVETKGLKGVFADFVFADGSSINLPATDPKELAYYHIFSGSKGNLTINCATGITAEMGEVQTYRTLIFPDLCDIDNYSGDSNVYDKITCTRNITANWNTICLPFATKSTKDTKLYVIDNLENGVITLKLAETLEAGKPALAYSTNNNTLYVEGSGSLIFSPVNEGENNCLVGTFTSTTVPGSDDSKYYFGLSAKTGKYVKVSSDVALNPYRAYIMCEKSSAPAAGLRHRIEGEDLNETAISDVVDALNSSAAEYYDINGRKISELKKGMNIISINGKKVKVLMK